MKNLPSESFVASWNMTSPISVIWGERTGSYRQGLVPKPKPRGDSKHAAAIKEIITDLRAVAAFKELGNNSTLKMQQKTPLMSFLDTINVYVLLTICNTDTPDWMFHKFTGLVSLFHVKKSPYKTFWKGRAPSKQTDKQIKPSLSRQQVGNSAKPPYRLKSDTSGMCIPTSCVALTKTRSVAEKSL